MEDNRDSTPERKSDQPAAAGSEVSGDRSASRIGEIAVESGFLTEGQVREILDVQALDNRKFGEIALGLSYLTSEQLAELLSKQAETFHDEP